MRHVIFLIAIIAAAVMVYEPLTALFRSSMRRDYHSLIPFIPFMSGYLVYLKRKVITSEQAYSLGMGTVVILIGLVMYTAGRTSRIHLNQNDYTSLVVCSAVVLLWGAFILAYGIHAFRNALFPLLFLIFMIPFPTAVMEKIIVFLQMGSTEFTNLLLLASGTPFLREGFVFHLPGQSIEVAKECSGIRSGMALFITALLAGHLFLKSWWRQVILVVCVLPITMLKNGIRITTLTLLGIYVDPRIFQSSLHREGGIPFFILALVMMAPVLYFLRKSEGREARKR